MKYINVRFSEKSLNTILNALLSDTIYAGEQIEMHKTLNDKQGMKAWKRSLTETHKQSSRLRDIYEKNFIISR